MPEVSQPTGMMIKESNHMIEGTAMERCFLVPNQKLCLFRPPWIPKRRGMMLLVNHLFADISYKAYQNTELIKCPHQTSHHPTSSA